jgi:hypothetical protein
MDQATRQEYNKKYYELNKDTIKGKLFAKVTCDICKRVVSHQNLSKHKKSSYCKSQTVSTDIEKLKADIEALKLLVNSKK